MKLPILYALHHVLVLRGLLLIAALASGWTLPANADESGGGPRELLIAYRSAPADRPAFRRYLLGEESAMLDSLKKKGVLKSYQILFNPFVNPFTWDAMTILSFNRFSDTARWQDIEKTMPGGLTPAGLKLAKPVDTYSADLPWDGSADDPGPAEKHVFYVIPYSYANAEQYRKYINLYVKPQVEGWMKAGVLSRYRIFMNRYPVGRPWDSLFVYEYRDLDAFGHRDEVVAKVREPLRNDPVWKGLNDSKSTIRSEDENTIAGLLVRR
jgi:hypothetical protein